MYAVTLNHIKKRYQLDTVEVVALDDITLSIPDNQFTVLSGPSGSGKTTLLNMIGCIDKPDSGEIRIGDCQVQQLSDDALSDFRRNHIGFIFQNFNLIPVLSAYENIEYPLVLAKVDATERRRRVEQLLQEVGLSERAKNLPGQLSGGQRQRVAIARALALQPRLVLADEPTANLDSQTGADVIALMRRMQQERQVSFVFSSHDPQVRAAADQVVHIRDGALVMQVEQVEGAVA